MALCELCGFRWNVGNPRQHPPLRMQVTIWIQTFGEGFHATTTPMQDIVVAHSAGVGKARSIEKYTKF